MMIWHCVEIIIKRQVNRFQTMREERKVKCEDEQNVTFLLDV